jgi:hypothetical protein
MGWMGSIRDFRRFKTLNLEMGIACSLGEIVGKHKDGVVGKLLSSRSLYRKRVEVCRNEKIYKNSTTSDVFCLETTYLLVTSL